MLIAYLPRRTWLHRIPASVKLFSLAMLSLILLPVDDWRMLCAALLVTLAVYCSLGRHGILRLASLKGFLPVLALIAAVQLYATGWQGAAGAAARLLMMVLLADLVTLSTTMQDMMAAIAPVLRPLRWIGLDPKRLTLAVTLVLRFVPLLMEMWRQRNEAWRARTGRKASFRLIGPFVADTLRLADHVADAVFARGFDVLGSAPPTKR